jgi:hypothetical protein
MTTLRTTLLILFGAAVTLLAIFMVLLVYVRSTVES